VFGFLKYILISAISRGLTYEHYNSLKLSEKHSGNFVTQLNEMNRCFKVCVV